MGEDDSIAGAMAKGEITERHARFLSALSPDDRELVCLRLVLPLRMNANTTRDAATMLDEISRRDGKTIAEIISQPPLSEILSAKSPAKERRENFMAVLRRLRFPEFSKIEDEFNVIANRIRADGGVTVTAPRFFEGDRIAFNLNVKSADELARLLERLRLAIDSGDAARLFALMRGES